MIKLSWHCLIYPQLNLVHIASASNLQHPQPVQMARNLNSFRCSTWPRDIRISFADRNEIQFEVQ